MAIYDKIRESAEYILERVDKKPSIGLILGSGLGELANSIEGAKMFPYGDIPNFPVSTVEGHEGRLVIGEIEGKTVAAMQGRFHYYEGYDMNSVTFPVRVMKLLGIETIMVTNAAGGVNEAYTPGDLMLISDQLNLSGDNPLKGKNMDEFGVRFPDMSNAYDKELREVVRSVAKNAGVELKEGVYACMSGPTYETPAEIRMLRGLGADAVGMSTVPEVIVAIHSGMKVIGISCITNMAAGILDQPLDHSEVIETSKIAREKFISLVRGTIAAV